MLTVIAYDHITVQTCNAQTETCHSTSSSPLVPIRLHSRYLQQIGPCCHTAVARSASKRQCRRKLYLLDEMPANQRKHWSTLHWTERHVRGTECHISRCDKCVIRGSRCKQGVTSYSSRSRCGAYVHCQTLLRHLRSRVSPCTGPAQLQWPSNVR